MTSFKYHLLFVVLVFLSSCNHDDFSDEIFNGTLLTEVRMGNEVYYRYTYTEANLILEEKSKFHYSKYQYNNRTQLIHSDHYWDERVASSNSVTLENAMQRTEWVNPGNTQKDTYFSFEYQKSGNLEKRIVHRLNNNTSSVDFFRYNKQGKIDRRTWYDDGKESGYDTYFYDERGNLSKVERYHILQDGSHKLQTTTEYEFDDKNNPYYSFRSLLIPGKNTNVNNIIKETYTLHFEVDKFIQPVQTTEYSYEYNSLDYPVKRSDGWEFIYN
jgi:hypothetical protein